MSVDAISSSAPLRRCASAVASGRIPGGVLGVVTRERRARGAASIGAAQIDPDHRHLMTRDTWFDLASLTKVIFTTPRILALAREGRSISMRR